MKSRVKLCGMYTCFPVEKLVMNVISLSHTYLGLGCSAPAKGAECFLQVSGLEPMAFMICSLVDFFRTRVEQHLLMELDSAMGCMCASPELSTCLSMDLFPRLAH